LGAAGECLALAKAVPEEKYTWRLMEGVRSFGEVFVHMAGSTLLFCSYAGLKTPPGPAHDLAAIYMKRGFEMPEIFAAERAIKTKEQTVDIMDQAFQLARDLIRQMPDSDLEKHVDFFGKSITTRALPIKLGDHLSQHLGQSIAYASDRQVSVRCFEYSGQSSIVGRPSPRPPSGEPSQRRRPPKTDSFQPAMVDPITARQVLMQSKPSNPDTSYCVTLVPATNSNRQ
jgi:hypothetical protein